VTRGDVSPGGSRPAVRLALAETSDRPSPGVLLAVQAEVMLALADLAAARSAAAKLDALTAGGTFPRLRALAVQTRGAVELAAGRADAALPTLREAWRIWRELAMPYEAARARILIGLACRALDDKEAAAVEFAAARRTLADLGAAPDVARADALAAPGTAPRPGGLSPREAEVLRLIAAGRPGRRAHRRAG
jgi:hypothetical protein